MCDLSVASKLKAIMHNDLLCLLLLRKPSIANQAVAKKMNSQKSQLHTVAVYSVALSEF